MGLHLNTNVASLNAQRQLQKNSAALNKSLQRLASGIKLNSAADGSAELSASSYMESQIRGGDAAASNVQQGLAMLNTADGALAGIEEHLQRIREIGVSLQNGTTTSTQYTDAQTEITARAAAITSIANNTKFDGKALLDGTNSAASSIIIQAGANSGDTVDISAALADNKYATIAGGAATTVTNTTTAGTLVTQVDTALSALRANQAAVGQQQNTLTDRLQVIAVQKENYSAAQSAIRDTDIAQETSNLTRLQILQQAAASTLAQANQSPSIAMMLLGK